MAKSKARTIYGGAMSRSDAHTMAQQIKNRVGGGMDELDAEKTQREYQQYLISKATNAADQYDADTAQQIQTNAYGELDDNLKNRLTEVNEIKNSGDLGGFIKTNEDGSHQLALPGWKYRDAKNAVADDYGLNSYQYNALEKLNQDAKTKADSDAAKARIIKERGLSEDFYDNENTQSQALANKAKWHTTDSSYGVQDPDNYTRTYTEEIDYAKGKFSEATPNVNELRADINNYNSTSDQRAKDYFTRPSLRESIKSLVSGENSNDLKNQIMSKYHLTDEEFEDLAYYGKELDDYDARQEQQTQAQANVNTGDAKKNVLGGAVNSAVALTTNPVAGFQGAAETAKYYANRIAGTSYDKHSPLNVNSAGFAASNATSDLQGATQQAISNKSKAAGILYGAAMSAAESAETGVLAPAGAGIGAGIASKLGASAKGIQTAARVGQNVAGLVPFGANAFASALSENVSSGMDMSDAMEEALISSGIEVGTEVVSLDKFWDIVKGNSRTARKALADFIASSVIEGSEEVAGDIAETIIDNIKNGDDSDYNDYVKNYIAQGLSEDEARTKAKWDLAAQAFEDGISGALSGAMGGGIAMATGRIAAQSGANEEFGNFTQEDYKRYADSINLEQESEEKYVSKSALDSAQRAHDLAEKYSKQSSVSNRERRELYYAVNDMTDTELQAREEKRLADEEAAAKAAKEQKEWQAHEAKVDAYNKERGAQYEEQTVEQSIEQELPEEIRAESNDSTAGEVHAAMAQAKTADELYTAVQKGLNSTNENTRKQTLSNLDNLTPMLEGKGVATESDIQSFKQTDAEIYQAAYAGEEVNAVTTRQQQIVNAAKQAAIRVQSENNLAQREEMTRNADNIRTDAGKEIYTSGYQTGMNAQSYDKIINTVMAAGRNGMTLEDAKDSVGADLAAVGGDEQALQTTIENAYNHSVNQSLADIMTESKNAMNLRDSVQRFGSGTYTDMRTDKSKAVPTANVMKAMAEITGLDIAIVDDGAQIGDSQGGFVAQNSTIYINAGMAQQAASTLFHEVGEFASVYNAEEFATFSTAMHSAMIKSMGSTAYNNMRQAYVMAYATEQGKTDMDLDKEITCDMLYQFLGSKDGMNRLISEIDANSKPQQAKSIKEKLADWIKNMAKALRDFFSEFTPTSYQKKVADAQIAKMEELSNMLTKSVANAVRNYQQAQMAELADTLGVNENPDTAVAGVNTEQDAYQLAFNNFANAVDNIATSEADNISAGNKISDESATMLIDTAKALGYAADNMEERKADDIDSIISDAIDDLVQDSAQHRKVTSAVHGNDYIYSGVGTENIPYNEENPLIDYEVKRMTGSKQQKRMKRRAGVKAPVNLETGAGKAIFNLTGIINQYEQKYGLQDATVNGLINDAKRAVNNIEQAIEEGRAGVNSKDGVTAIAGENYAQAMEELRDYAKDNVKGFNSGDINAVSYQASIGHINEFMNGREYENLLPVTPENAELIDWMIENDEENRYAVPVRNARVIEREDLHISEKPAATVINHDFSYKALTESEPIDVYAPSALGLEEFEVLDEQNDEKLRKRILSLARANILKFNKEYGFKQINNELYNNDLGGYIVMGKPGLSHILNRGGHLLEDGIVPVNAPAYILNSKVVNEMDGERGNADSSYILMGAYIDGTGLHVIRSIVNHYDKQYHLGYSQEVLHAQQHNRGVLSELIPDAKATKKEDASQLSAEESPERAFSLTSSKITVQRLLEACQENYPNSLSRDVAKHLGYKITKPDFASQRHSRVIEDASGRKLSAGQQEFYADESPLLMEDGKLKRYYHGTARMDRVGTVFRKDRATSGPMAYFTDNLDIATNYSKNKQDTSTAYEEAYMDYSTQFRMKVRGREISIEDAWYYLPYEKQAEIKAKAPHVTTDERTGDPVYNPNYDKGLGNFDSYLIREHRGNYLAALRDSWLDSGTLFNNEAEYLDVLKLVGLDNVAYKDPYYREEGVYEVYLHVTNPLDTTNIPQDVVDALRKASRRTRFNPEKSADADFWDKNSQAPWTFMERLDDDIANGTTYVWTSIPDWVTKTLKKLGYDGISDLGGKYSGYGHQVVIPFEPNQVKNVDNENPTSNKDIRRSRVIEDTSGTPLTPEQHEYFKDSKAVDENGRLKVMYHGSGYGGFKVFDSRFSDDGMSFFFTDDQEIAASYSGSHDLYAPTSSDIEEDDRIRNRTASVNYQVYLDLKNPLEVDAGGAQWNAIPRYDAQFAKDVAEFSELMTDTFGDDESIDVLVNDLLDTMDDFHAIIEDRLRWKDNPTEYVKERQESFYKLREIAERLDENIDWIRSDYLYSYDIQRAFETGDIYVTTRELSREAKENGNDGVIIKNLIDAGPQNDWWEVPSTIMVVFNSNQVKSINNENPTEDVDIRKSIDVSDNRNMNEEDISANRDEIASILEQGAEALKGTKVNKQAIQNIAMEMKRKYGSAIDLDTFTGNLSKLFAYLHSGKTINYNDFVAVMQDVARPAIDAAYTSQASREDYAQFRNAIDGMEFSLTMEQRKAISSAFGSMKAFQRYYPEVHINPEAANFADQWSSLVDLSRGLLDEGVDAVDMPSSLVDALDALRPSANDWQDNTQAAHDMALDIIGKYLGNYHDTGANKGVVNEFVKNAEKQVKSAQKGWKDKIKADYNERLKAERAYQKEIAKNRVAKANERSAEQIAKLRAKNATTVQGIREKLKRNNILRQIYKSAGKLYEYMTSPSDQNHIPSSVQEPVFDLMNALDLTQATIRQGADGLWHARIMAGREIGPDGNYVYQWKDITAATRAEVLQQYEEAMAAGAGSDASRKWYERMRSVADLYSKQAHGENDGDNQGLNEFMQGLDEELAEDFQRIINPNTGKASVADLDAEDLDVVNKVLKNVLHAVNQINRSYSMPSATISELAQGTMAHADKVNGRKNHNKQLDSVIDFLTLSNATPETYLHAIGADRMTDLLLHAQDAKAWKLREAQEYNKTILEGIDSNTVKEWENKVESYADGKIQLTKAQVMSLYELMQREDAASHRAGGFKADAVGNKTNTRNKVAFLTDEELMDIVGTLTADERRVADAMQKFLAVNCAAWGNEASQAMFGYDKFGDPHYFPMKVDKTSVSANIGELTGSITNSIRNMGMTKAVQAGANNALILSSIFDVYAKHISDMATYNAWAPTVTDMIRFYNYKETNEIEDGEHVFYQRHTTRDAINQIMGQGGQQYFTKLVSAIQSREQSAFEGGGIIEALTGNAKKAAVMANLRVVVQQPTAIFRAGKMIDYKYLNAGVAGAYGKEAKELQDRTSAVSWIKNQGNIDGYITTSLKSQITGIQDFKDKVSDKAGWLAGKADEITWSAMYRAVYAEQVDKLGKDKVGTQEFEDAVNDRFEKIMLRTQVYDGTITRSQFMRSPDWMNKMQSAFMAEPVKTYNIVLRDMIDYVQSGKGTKDRSLAKKALAKSTAVLLITNAVNAAVQSLWDAIRNAGDPDEEDNSFLARALAAFGIDINAETPQDVALGVLEGNFVDNINMLNNIPIIADYAEDAMDTFEELALGKSSYSSSSSDLSMSGVQHLGDALKAVLAPSEKQTVYGMLAKVTRAFSDLSGYPLYAAQRDIAAIYNVVAHDAAPFFGVDDMPVLQTRTKNTKKRQAKLDVYDTMMESTDLDEVKAAIEDAVSQGNTYKTINDDVTENLKASVIEMYSTSPSEATKVINRLSEIRAYMSDKEGTLADKSHSEKVEHYRKNMLEWLE